MLADHVYAEMSEKVQAVVEATPVDTQDLLDVQALRQTVTGLPAWQDLLGGRLTGDEEGALADEILAAVAVHVAMRVHDGDALARLGDRGQDLRFGWTLLQKVMREGLVPSAWARPLEAAVTE